MKELLIWEQAYERSSVHLVIPILVMGVLLYGIFWVLMKKGITKRQKNISIMDFWDAIIVRNHGHICDDIIWESHRNRKRNPSCTICILYRGFSAGQYRAIAPDYYEHSDVCATWDIVAT